MFPPRPRCRRCGGRKIAWRTPATTGQIVTYSVAHQAAYAAYRADEPYIVAIDGGPQLMTNLVNVADVEAVSIGMLVQLTVEHRSPTAAVPQFRPLEPSDTDQHVR